MDPARMMIFTNDKLPQATIEELAVMLCEKMVGMRRPEGLTAAQALAAMDDDVAEGWLRAGRAAGEIVQAAVSEALKQPRPDA